MKTGVRLSVDYVVVGEIRGEEAREWAHSILLGHGAVTTFHAESPEAALLRLASPPISVDPQVIAMLNVIVKTNVLESGTHRVFRHEVHAHEEGRVIPLYVYNPAKDTIELNPEIGDPLKELKFLERIVNTHKVSREELAREFSAMVRALRRTYEEFSRRDPSFDRVSFEELSKVLYRNLELEMTGSASRGLK